MINPTYQEKHYFIHLFNTCIMKANKMIQAIITVLENSASFQTGNVTYVISNDKVRIFSPKHEQFYSTDVVIILSGFTPYFTYDHEQNKVVLVVS